MNAPRYSRPRSNAPETTSPQARSQALAQSIGGAGGLGGGAGFDGGATGCRGGFVTRADPPGGVREGRVITSSGSACAAETGVGGGAGAADGGEGARDGVTTVGGGATGREGEATGSAMGGRPISARTALSWLKASAYNWSRTSAWGSFARSGAFSQRRRYSRCWNSSSAARS